MNAALRKIMLIACISQNVRQFARLMMANAFAFTSHHSRHSSSDYMRGFGSIAVKSLHFDGKSSTGYNIALDINRQCDTPSYYYAHHLSLKSTSAFTTTKLYSSTAPDSELITNENNDILEIDPYSDEAKGNLLNFYNHHNILSSSDDIESIHNNLLRLTEEVLAWNQKLNLVSRKDCNAAVVYHRHILPSVALLPLIMNVINAQNEQQQQSSTSDTKFNVVDVGTGGGFPGLPLALLLPNVQFTLVDSVQKKLIAVSEMAAELDIPNVRIHWGRCEEMYVDDKGKREHYGRYNIVLGRSVTALPRFCSWVSDLMYKDKEGFEERDGRLIYIIGGELDELVESRTVQDTPIDELLQRELGTSDKRALIFNAGDVEEISEESGEKNKIVRSGPGKKNKNNKKNQGKVGGKKLAKGAWSKRQSGVKKERGYDDFQRFEF